MSENVIPYLNGLPISVWDSADRAAWLASRVKSRSYADEVLSKIDALRERFDVVEFGQIDYGGERYPLLALKTRDWRDDLPVALVTGGVHGYETSGVQGAFAFIAAHGGDYAGKINILLAPCVSPWAYERVQRWNAEALDPNRSFTGQGGTQEAAALMRLLAPLQGRVLLHIDLHETTDSDETEFRPAKAARDGEVFVPGEIPDGFYLCGDEKNPQMAFQTAVNAAVAEVTHIAPSDAKGEIIGTKVVAPGVILYDYKALGLCAGMTDARFTTTTEVYPDSPRATPEICNAAQVAAVRAAIAYVLNV